MVKLGWQYHRAGYFDQAEMLYQQALQADPQNVKAKHYLAGIPHHKGQFHRAAELIRQVIAADPNEASYHINLGLALVALGQLDEADASFGEPCNWTAAGQTLISILGSSFTIATNLLMPWFAINKL